ncbi:hypothetical protein SAY86_011138 [Trapa natans]|uniref:non-specific serine/threonine protein kinase n=1 Tax=Trapa natans TaxID=22666 RepID=A0AAN7LKM6_TRANT|nr:hypothetical protein SAY86_011138 [Trapa natans]
MTTFSLSSINAFLAKRTSVFGLRMWVVIGISFGSLIVAALFLIIFCLTCCRGRRRRHSSTKRRGGQYTNSADPSASVRPDPRDIQDVVPRPSPPPPPVPEIRLDVRRADHRAAHSDLYSSGDSRETAGFETDSAGISRNADGDVFDMALAWGRRYSLRELEAATGGLSEESVIGKGDDGVVYCGILENSTVVAIKSLSNRRGQAERDFKLEVEAIGRVKHKNLVKLLGYCVEGPYRMLVYEYVDNGNLGRWLHGDFGDDSPLTWDIRMNIIVGTAKALAYLHEGLEPKVVHRNVKSSNILLDRQWNPKVSDFGLAKLLEPEVTHVSTRVVGTFGYLAPEYAHTGKLTEKSDVYSFGVLIMEVITGRIPVDYSRPRPEVNLVDWLKATVGDGRAEEVVDPKLPDMPTSKVLKRILLVALLCVDPDLRKRPTMGYIIHMLEAAGDSLIRNLSQR